MALYTFNAFSFSQFILVLHIIYFSLKRAILLLHVKFLDYFQKQSSGVFYKTGVLRNFSNLCQRLFFRLNFLIIFRSSRQEVFYKKGALKNFQIHRCFPVNFEKFLRTPLQSSLRIAIKFCFLYYVNLSESINFYYP